MLKVRDLNILSVAELKYLNSNYHHSSSDRMINSLVEINLHTSFFTNVVRGTGLSLACGIKST